MITMLLCCWTSLVIFLWMVQGKYYWTRPPWTILLAFAGAGLASSVPAMVCNWFLSEKTAFWAFDLDPFNSFAGFCIGAGVSEELWKFGCGLIVVTVMGRDIGDAGRMLGFVTVGLVFATVENFSSYSGISTSQLAARGFIAVPMHAAMGVIQGIAANRAYRGNVAWPLFLGYGVSIGLHTLHDTWGVFLPEPWVWLPIIVMMAMLGVWALQVWWRVSEVPGLSRIQRPRKASKSVQEW